MPNTNLALLHPTYRDLSQGLEVRVQHAGLPIRRYECWRDPARQAALFAFGRASGVGAPGHHKTYERAWESSHQYGLAEDWVWYFGAGWSWAPPDGHTWDEFHALVTASGLEFLRFEEPHVQMRGFHGRNVLAGKPLPPGGSGSAWEDNLERAAVAWGLRDRKDDHGIVQPGAPAALVAGGRPSAPVPAGMVYDEERGLCLPEDLKAPDVPDGMQGA